MKKIVGFTLIEMMIVVAIIGILLEMAVPALQNFVIRAKVSEGIHLAMAAKVAVMETYQSTSVWPLNNISAGLPAANMITGDYVSSVLVSNNIITVTFANDVNIAGKTVLIVGQYGVADAGGVGKYSLASLMMDAFSESIASAYASSSESYSKKDKKSKSSDSHSSDSNNNSHSSDSHSSDSNNNSHSSDSHSSDSNNNSHSSDSHSSDSNNNSQSSAAGATPAGSSGGNNAVVPPRRTSVAWTCVGGTLPAKYLPSKCR